MFDFYFAQKNDQSKLCFTFDDPTTNDILDYKQNELNSFILKKLRAENIQAILFVCGKRINNGQGQSLLNAWDSDGHLIANHTFSHKNYNNPKNTFHFFKNDFLKNDSLINKYSHYSKLFRFPYLKEGDTAEKRDSLRLFMKNSGYSNGYVTIDASDWYYDSRLINDLKANPKLNLEPYKKIYLEHIFNRAMFYDSLASILTGRKIHHSLLLHHNLTSALFLEDLIKMFKSKGWLICSAAETYKDEIYSKVPDIIPAGESLIWALAKESGKFDEVLRYPAEDSIYEEQKFDKLSK